MTLSLLLAISIFALVAGVLLFRIVPMLQTYFTYRGKRLVTCPETHKPAAVDVAAGKAAASAFVGPPMLYLNQCTRWPERQNCGQDCLQQIEYDPENCRVWNIVASWYEGKNCVLCHKRFEQLRHLDHAPALMSPDRQTAEWKQFPPEQLPEIFSSYLPLCWNCHIAETFRREHPELVVDRERDLTNDCREP
jgi:hypothetical protein